jgi:hypothetical protein
MSTATPPRVLGTAQVECFLCRSLFANLRAFDMHRDTRPRRCLTAEEMRDEGFQQKGAFWNAPTNSRRPSDQSKRKAMPRLQSAKEPHEFYDVGTATRDRLSLACRQCDRDYRNATGISAVRLTPRGRAVPVPRSTCPTCKRALTPPTQQPAYAKLAAKSADARLTDD